MGPVAGEPSENHALFERFANAGDVEGLLELYEEDAIYVPTRGQRLQGLRRGPVR